MADAEKTTKEETGAAAAPDSSKPALESGTYEIIRSRLDAQSAELRSRLDKLNEARKDVFGAIEFSLTGTERITTANNCVPRDMAAIGRKFLFGYNVFFGLKTETSISDVLAVYEFADGVFKEQTLDPISDQKFLADFRDLYKYYKDTRFLKFLLQDQFLYMVFQIGKSVEEIKAFKWAIDDQGGLIYLDNRSEHECRLPPQHEFEWTRTRREMFRLGAHPHISIEDRVFVEAVGGDLTIKVEDNTASGEGIYSEPVQERGQNLDDAEISFAIVGNLVLLKIRPYQEKEFRHIVYSEKIRKAVRLDAIASSCLLLPDGQGLIFPRGYYLQTGEFKAFDHDLEDMRFERRLISPNGEDYLYVFHNREKGAYILLSYNIIEQTVDTPLICGGFSLFEDGKLLHFKEAKEPQKHHALQIWQTPYVGGNYTLPSVKIDSYLYKIGNRDIVRFMAEAREVLTLLAKEDSFANLYLDISKRATDVLDTYFWLDKPEAFVMRDAFIPIRDTAAKAIDEFEKVERIRRNTRDQLAGVRNRAKEVISRIERELFNDLNVYVKALADLRALRGDIISCRDLRYIDLPTVDSLEAQNAEYTVTLSGRCVAFLLQPEALDPYRKKVAEQQERIPGLKTVVQARETDKETSAAAAELQMLIEIVGNLQIEDSTQRTVIIDAISTIFSELNRIRSSIKARIQELASGEGRAEFQSQIKLLSQSVINALDACDSPERCDEQLTRQMVAIEELEGRFADFEEFATTLGDKRQEAYAAFEARKVALIEARSKRASGLMTAAERILKGVQSKLAQFKTVNEIHGYLASDLMVDKVRSIVKSLQELKDSVKADDLQTRLKTLREEAIRQLRDRQELYADGDSLIRLGTYQFSVNRQPLDLTYVQRDGSMFFHLTGTNYLEKIEEPRFLEFQNLWNQELISETNDMYRAEYLAFCLYRLMETADGRSGISSGPTSNTSPIPTHEDYLKLSPLDREKVVQTFMGPRYQEGYLKGVHDRDASLILANLIETARALGQLRFIPSARALAGFYWNQLIDPAEKSILEAKLKGAGVLTRVFPNTAQAQEFRNDLLRRLGAFVQVSSIFSPALVPEAAEYLLSVMGTGEPLLTSLDAANLIRGFQQHLRDLNILGEFARTTSEVRKDPLASFELFRQWVRAYAETAQNPEALWYVDEAALLLFLGGTLDASRISSVPGTLVIEGLAGSHPLIQQGNYSLNLTRFFSRLGSYVREVVPRFEAFAALRKSLLGQRRENLKLDQFQARVLTSFVRNKLIDSVYLPLIGTNMAKQIGSAGENKQTDRMGMLLLISPPGYGKTTLMEYIANRLGLIFMKINGPSIGHQVTSIDPAEAPNAAAREEMEKINLALAMGDNVMLYLDDIQHCNTELLQKFISLCDAQRKIEGVFQGKTRTFDLRGKKFAVVMAGNPYTESGEKFQIPDMLANRADTYNLGDIIGGHSEAFQLSYLENAAGANPILRTVVGRNPADLHGIVKLAETGSRDGVEFTGNYSSEELSEFAGVMKKLFRVRDVVLTVNREYIASAAQSEGYRTKPAFKLQGSYRNMTRLAEKVLPIMNQDEMESMIRSHYENEAQTLAAGAETNLLQFKDLLGIQTPEEKARWEEILKVFKKNQFLKGFGGDDRMGPLIAQLTFFTDNVAAIRDVLKDFSGKFN